MSDSPAEKEPVTATQEEEQPALAQEQAAAVDEKSADEPGDAAVEPAASASETKSVADDPDAPDTEEDAELRAAIAALADELHDVDVAHAEAVEESHMRSNAEERLAAAKSTAEEAADAKAAAVELSDAAAARATGRTEDATKQLYADIRSAEDGADESGSAAQWRDTVESESLEALLESQPEDGFTGVELAERLAVAKASFADLTTLAQQLRDDDAKEASVSGPSPGDRVVEAAAKELDVELRRIAKLQTTVRAAVNEQRFHLRRGSHLKQKTVKAPARLEFLELDQQRHEHSRVCAAINEEEWQKASALRDLEAVKREARNQLRIAAEEKATLLANIDELKAALEEIDWEYQSLAEENSELRDLRRSMIRAQSAIRMNAKQ